MRCSIDLRPHHLSALCLCFRFACVGHFPHCQSTRRLILMVAFSVELYSHLMIVATNFSCPIIHIKIFSIFYRNWTSRPKRRANRKHYWLHIFTSNLFPLALKHCAPFVSEWKYVFWMWHINHSPSIFKLAQSRYASHPPRWPFFFLVFFSVCGCHSVDIFHPSAPSIYQGKSICDSVILHIKVPTY